MALNSQIILGNSIYLPITSRDRYKCYPIQLGETVQMISGRTVWEVRGNVWRVEYSYDYMGNDLMRSVMEILRSGQSFTAAVLPDNSEEPVVSQFLTESFPQPTYAFSRAGIPYWHNISFVLREVTPHA